MKSRRRRAPSWGTAGSVETLGAEGRTVGGGRPRGVNTRDPSGKVTKGGGARVGEGRDGARAGMRILRPVEPPDDERVSGRGGSSGGVLREPPEVEAGGGVGGDGDGEGRKRGSLVRGGGAAAGTKGPPAVTGAGTPTGDGGAASGGSTTIGTTAGSPLGEGGGGEPAGAGSGATGTTDIPRSRRSGGGSEGETGVGPIRGAGRLARAAAVSAGMTGSAGPWTEAGTSRRGCTGKVILPQTGRPGAGNCVPWSTSCRNASKKARADGGHTGAPATNPATAHLASNAWPTAPSRTAVE